MWKDEEARADYEQRKTAAKKKLGAAPGEPPEKPVLPRVICSDTTIEKLAEILEDNSRGILVARDELSAWLGSFCRYKGKAGGTDLPNWLEMHRAGTILYDRKTGERQTIIVPRAAASVTGGIQLGVLVRALTPEFLDAGLAARLLMAMPPKLPKRWSESEIAPEVEEAYQSLLDRLISLNFDTDKDEKVPHILVLSSDAKALWASFYNEWGGEQAAAEGELAAAFSKLEAYAARFALIHHVVTHVSLESDDIRAVGARSMEAGITLARWFAAEARRIYGALTETTEEGDARRLVEFIQARAGSITVKDLQRSNSRKYPGADVAEQALEQLVNKGWARWQDRPLTSKGGRPTRDCVLNPLPTTDDTDETIRDGGAPPTKPSDNTPPDPESPRDLGGIVGFVNSRNARKPSETPPGANGGFVGQSEVSSEGIEPGDAWERSET
jgi:hypothetical protein